MLTCMNADLLCLPASHPQTLQALVLSHEMASPEEMEPYLQEVLRPLRPLVLFGRAAGLEPKCHKQEAVYYGWRDFTGVSLCRRGSLLYLSSRSIMFPPVAASFSRRQGDKKVRSICSRPDSLSPFDPCEKLTVSGATCGTSKDVGGPV